MQPTFKIVANSKDITAKISDRLISLEITDQAGVKSDRATITIDDRDQQLEIPATGATLEISIGYIGAPLVRMGTYYVDEVDIEGPARQMAIRANAVDMNGGIKGPKERSWQNVTFGDIVKTIAKEHKLSPSIPSALANENLGHIDQTESDMQLLTRICAEQGATFKCADGRLIVAVRKAGTTASGKPLPSLTINANSCASWSATFQNRGNYKRVTAHWHDKTTGIRTEVTAGAGDPAIHLKYSYKSEKAAEKAAKSKLASLGGGVKTLNISECVGNPALSAECIATLTGFRAGLDGAWWVVNEVTHSVSNSGYTNSLTLELKQ